MHSAQPTVDLTPLLPPGHLEVFSIAQDARAGNAKSVAGAEPAELLGAYAESFALIDPIERRRCAECFDGQRDRLSALQNILNDVGREQRSVEYT